LIRGLDDSVDLSLARRVAPAEEVVIHLCDAADRDVVVFQPDRLGEIFVNVDAADVVIDVFAFDLARDELGTPLTPGVSADNTSQLLTLDARLEPFAFVLSRGAETTTTRVAMTFDIAPPGDQCQTAEPLPGESGTLGGSSADYRDDLNAQDLGDCTEHTSPGEDRVFEVVLATGERLNATLTPRTSDFDTAIYLLSRCPTAPFEQVCVAGDDRGFGGDPDSISFTNPGAPQSFFLVVDSFFGANYEYDLTWSIN
jgi:hypothetical protein